MMLIFMTGLGIFLIATPKYADDLWYLMRMRSWFAQQGITDPTQGGDIIRYGVPWEEIFTTFGERRATDNGRLCNLVAMFFLLLPKWIGSCLALLGWGGVMALTLRLAGADSRNPLTVATALLLWTFGMAWSQQIGALDYQFNYLLSGLPALWLLVMLFRIAEPGCCRTVAIAAASFLTGCWHEGFALPLLAGIAADMLMFRQMRGRREIVAVAGLCAGLSLLLCVPATAVRLAVETAGKTYGVAVVLRAFLTHPVFLLYVMTACVCMGCKRWRHLMRSPLQTAIALSALTAIILQIVTTQTRRVGWWADEAAVTGLLAIAARTLIPALKRRKAICAATTALFAAAFSAYWATVDVNALRMARDFREVTAELRRTGDPVVFHTTGSFETLPFYCMSTPDMGMLSTPESLAAIKFYYDLPEYPSVIPSELEYVTSSAGEPLTPDGRIRREGDLLFGKVDCGRYEILPYDCDFGPYGVCRVMFCHYPFRSRGDGKEYMYLYPWKKELPLRLRGIKQITRHDR